MCLKELNKKTDKNSVVWIKLLIAYCNLLQMLENVRLKNRVEFLAFHIRNHAFICICIKQNVFTLHFYI